MGTIATIVRYQLRDVLRNKWVIAYALFFFAITEALLVLGGTAPRALLSLLNVVLLVVPLVTVVFGTIYWHGAREFTELLLAQPVRRSALFHGLFASLVLPLSLAYVLGVGIPLLASRSLDAESIRLALLMLLVGVALTGVFGAIAVLIAGVVADRLAGLGVALAVWLGLTLVYDAGVLATTMAFSRYPLETPLLMLTFANPVDLARVLLVLRFDVSALMGYTGAVFHQVLGTPAGTAAAIAALAAWTAAPGLLALRAFKRKDW